MKSQNGEARDNGREGLRKQEQSQEIWRNVEKVLEPFVRATLQC